MTSNSKTELLGASVNSPSANAHRLPNSRMLQNFHLVWLDRSINQANDNDCQSSLEKLREVVNNVTTFVDIDKCIDFITDVHEEKTFMIISEEFSKIITSIVADISHVSSVYIFSRHNAHHENLPEQHSKIKGIYTDIACIYEALKQDAHDCEQNSVSISFVKTADGTAKLNLDTLDPSFMYTKILKDILLNIDFEQVHFNEFLTYCREQFAGNPSELRHVDKIEKEYHDHQPIWWYTYQCFLYSMLNRALRLMEVDTIIKMGFFLRDVHQHIATLHAEQYSAHNNFDSFTVYRGQGLSQTDFNSLKNTQGGLLAFNNFLSTSYRRDVSLRFARRVINIPDLVGVLFILKIDPSIPATPFANVKDASCYQTEEEILFSMHSVFRIGHIEQIEKNKRLWQVELTLTSDHDAQLEAVTTHIQKEIEGSTGWFRLGILLMRIAQYDKAYQMFDIILHQTTDETEKGNIYYYLGCIKMDQGEYSKAVMHYEESLKIRKNTLPANDPDLAASYNNIGIVYDKMGEYSKALSSFEKALEIQQQTLPTNHQNLATSYNNIGGVYSSIGQYLKAFSSYEKALEIQQKILPVNHPDIAASYNNIGLVCFDTGDYSKALPYYEKAAEIFEKTLPANHPDLAASYNNIGRVYNNMDEYSKALSSYEKALEIQQKSLPVNHPDIAASYNNIGLVCFDTGDYSKALSYYEIALEIQQQTLPANHPDLAASYNNIGRVYNNMDEYSKALSFYEKALEIRQKSLPGNHPALATSYNNIGSVNFSMGEYLKALSYYEKELEIRQKTLPADHLNLATSYDKIGGVYFKMGKYSEALSYFKHDCDILQRSLPPDDPAIQVARKNIEAVKRILNDSS